MKKYLRGACSTLLFAAVFGMLVLSGCGGGGDAKGNIEGSCEEVLARVYENASLDEEQRTAMNEYVAAGIPAESAEYILGTTEIAYTDAVCSAPQINVVPYQCVLLRLEDESDAESAKQLLLENANPRMWVCVEAESVVVENNGDLVLFLMADADVAEAIRTAFLDL